MHAKCAQASNKLGLVQRDCAGRIAVLVHCNSKGQICIGQTAEVACLKQVSLVDWISDTCPQGYTDVQSLVKCLDHRYCGRDSSEGMQGCAMH